MTRPGPVTVAPRDNLAPPAPGQAGTVETLTGSRTRRNVMSKLKVVIPPTIVFGVIIGIWYFVSAVVLQPDQQYMLPLPHEVIRVGFIESTNRSELLDGLWQTSKVTIYGLLIAMVLGVAAGMLMVQAKWLEMSLYPWAIILQTVPILALIPMISFWFGYDLKPRVIVCVLISFFPIVSNTVFGLQAADKGQHELFSLHKANRFVRLWKLQLPAALPAMFAGFRVAAGLSVIGAIVGEFYFRQGAAGLGTLLSVYVSRLEGEQLFAAILLSSLLGIAVFIVFGFLGNRVVGRWYRANRG